MPIPAQSEPAPSVPIQTSPVRTLPAAEKSSSVKPRWRLRLAVGGGLLLGIAVLAITPPLLHVNRFQRRIAASMSQSLGRPVHMDNVTVHLLPVPGFTLQNLVVSEDPAFGYEPIIRAMTVETSLRPSSLWRRQVEFSTIRFVEPSLNLVRNPDGRWNLSELLMHASRVDTAPTAQRRAGPTPRFPYIEATGARVNLKLGQEKTPFSLTDADFALWLPSPQQWRIRLDAKPARTDTNLSDPGTLHLEGGLSRASTAASIPLELHATWTGAPLGEASRLLTGDDAGWRGALTVEASVNGSLGQAHLQTNLHVEDLRRADFVPARSLDVQLNCVGTAALTASALRQVRCGIPDGAPQPLMLTAELLDTENLRKTAAVLAGSYVPASWLLDWARLFSPFIPAGLAQKAGVELQLVRRGTGATGWNGTAVATWLHPAGSTAEAEPDPVTVAVHSGPEPLTLRLSPVTLRPGPGSALALSGTASAASYDVQLAGTATDHQVRVLARTMPPLALGLKPLLPASDAPALRAPNSDAAASAAVRTFAVDCHGAYSEAAAVCTETASPATPPTHARSAKHRR